MGWLSLLKTRAAGWIGLAMIFIGLIGAILWFRAEAADAKTDLVTVTADRDALKVVNDNNKETMDRIAAMQEENSRIASYVDSQTNSSTKRASDARRSISSERQNNADVEDYLRQRPPGSVASVLNNRKESADQ